MAGDYNRLFKLTENQENAANPDELIWLSASAGTGKTQVLSARVLRLLLKDVRPEAILALTFTKAGASEMKHRINERLAKWVMATDVDLNHDLEAIGEKPSKPLRDHARTCFARVLDARGGGLRIQTIHSFCQSLLSAFPAEAGISPGFRLIDGREEAALPHAVLAELADTADEALLEKLKALALDRGEGGVESFLKSCAAAADDLASLDGVNLDAMLSRILTGTLDAQASVIEACGEPLAGKQLLIDYMDVLRRWNKDSGYERIERISEWLASSPVVRAQTTSQLLRGWQTGSGTIYTLPKTDEYQSAAATVDAWGSHLHEMAVLAGQAKRFADALTVGRHYAIAWRAAKERAGLVDYNDLIRRTVALFQTPGMGEWVRYKLDQGTDHILIDEAQDTNSAQWDIVRALAGEFFAGEGARDDSIMRTIFAVGDFKQAIFGFQGTNPRNFRDARDDFEARASAVDRQLHDLELSKSFRTTMPVLQLVDEVIAVLGVETMGVDEDVPEHRTDIGQFGAVTLLPPVSGTEVENAEDEGEEDWVSDAPRHLAKQLADQLVLWLGDEPLWLNKQGRMLEPRDVLILLRSRGDLAQLIVARLHERGIAVAGLDRLALGSPLAVRDLLACVRFALQPEDDLNLACLLVSPLIGWSQNQLYEASKLRGDKRLWVHLDQEARAALLPILNAADMAPPYQFLETILSGAMQGRRKLLARLGEEARDPIDALLNATLEFEQAHPPSLQTFIDWFDRGEVEIKREADSGGNAVRVMTAHGAKGLQAPLVILADATRNPDANVSGKSALSLRAEPEGITLPLFRPRKAERFGVIKDAADAADAAEREEHWRLLYVALTRAEERLVIGGALTSKDKDGPPESSWYAMVRQAMLNLGAEERDTGCWVGKALHFEVTGDSEAKQLPLPIPDDLPRPLWLDVAAPVEAAPAKPLSPSSLGRDDESSPPPSPEMQAAAERGRLLHGLFERLPAIPAAQREVAAIRWLEANGAPDPQILAHEALAVIDNPDFAAIFAPDALAEAPLAGVVDTMVIAGTVDRLLVGESEVLVVDFKTGRRVPSRIENAPTSHLRQMSAYAALLRSIFPDKAVKAALLYTHGPALMVLPDSLLDTHKPSLQAQQDNF